MLLFCIGINAAAVSLVVFETSLLRLYGGKWNSEWYAMGEADKLGVDNPFTLGANDDGGVFGAITAAGANVDDNDDDDDDDVSVVGIDAGTMVGNGGLLRFSFVLIPRISLQSTDGRFPMNLISGISNGLHFKISRKKFEE